MKEIEYERNSYIRLWRRKLKVKESEKINKYLDLARELEKL